MYYENFSKFYSIFGLKFRVKLKPKHYKKVGLIFDSKEGIGNRIFGLMNVINYFTPDTIDIFWDDKDYVLAKFYDLFDCYFKTKINEYNDMDGFVSATKENDLIIEKPSVSLKTIGGKTLGLKYNAIKFDTFLKYQKNFQFLKPKSDILERINQNTPKKDFIALQIRNASDWEDFGRNEDLNLFVSEMEKLTNKDKKLFYLSAFNEKIYSELTDKYKGQILELKNKNYKSMKDAVCDLYIMAKAKKAIYSYGSTFGELAFWLNPNKQDVIVVGTQKNWINKKK